MAALRFAVQRRAWNCQKLPENARKCQKMIVLHLWCRQGIFAKKINDGQRFKSGAMSTGLNSLKKMLVCEPDRS